jgi:membrane protein
MRDPRPAWIVEGRSSQILRRTGSTRRGRFIVEAAPPASSANSLRGFIARILNEVSEDNVFGLAAQMAFFFSLSLFPFFIFLAAVAGVLPSTHLWDHVLKWVTLYLPEPSQAFVFNTVAGLTRGRETFISFGFLTAVWSACEGVISMTSALNTAYEVHETRPWWKRIGIAVLMVLTLGLLFLASFGMLTAGHIILVWVLSHTSPGVPPPAFWRVGHWIISLFLLVLGMALIDYFLPNVKQPWHWVSPAIALAVIVWIPGSLAFNFYVRYMGSYNRMYGALGAFIILMVWIYILSAIILIGTEANSELLKIRRQESESHGGSLVSG